MNKKLLKLRKPYAARISMKVTNNLTVTGLAGKDENKKSND
jgi:hypothetical protein